MYTRSTPLSSTRKAPRNHTDRAREWASGAVWRLGRFDRSGLCKYDSGMIAMANPLSGYVTVQQAMLALNARAHSTILRMLRDEDDKSADRQRKPLVGFKIEGHGWMISQASIDALKAREEERGDGVGFPRGRSRLAGKRQSEPATQPPKRRQAKAAKTAKASKRPRRS